MKNILLTGGLGYIGSKFIELYSEKFEITVLDTNYFHGKVSQKVKVIDKDVRHISISDLENIDFVIHMAELSNDPLGEFNSDLTYKINHLATKKLIALCEKAKIKKFIYMSSCSVYGKTLKLVNEESKVNPLTNYAIQKVNNENFIIENNFETEIIILRNATVYGYSRNLRLDLVINDLTYNGVLNNKIILTSDGTPQRPFVHVSDLVGIIYEIIKSDLNLNKEIINIGSKKLNYSIIEVANIIKELLNIENITIGKKDKDQRSYDVDFSKLTQLLPNYKFKYNLRNGILDLIKNINTYSTPIYPNRIEAIKSQLKNKKLDKDLYWIQ